MAAISPAQPAYQRPWSRRPIGKTVRRIAFYILLLVLWLPFFFVFAWMIEAALKTQMQNTAIPPLLIFRPTLENFVTVFSRNPMWRFLLNSVIIGAGATGLGSTGEGAEDVGDGKVMPQNPGAA